MSIISYLQVDPQSLACVHLARVAVCSQAKLLGVQIHSCNKVSVLQNEHFRTGNVARRCYNPPPMIERSAVLLNRQQLLDPARVADALLPCGIPWAEVTRACRRQRGILFRRIDSLLAEAVAEQLSLAGIPCRAVLETDLADFPHTLRVRSISADDLGLRIPSLEAMGRIGFIPWEDVRLAHACVYEGEAASALGDATASVVKGETVHEMHVQLGRESFQQLSSHEFDWATYLDTAAADAINKDRLRPRKYQKPRKKLFRVGPPGTIKATPELSRYSIGNPSLQSAMLIWAGGDAFLVECGAGQPDDGTIILVNGDRVAGHWLRGFQQLAAQICTMIGENAPTPSIRNVASRSNPALALVYDMAAFEDECRWWLTYMLEAANPVSGRESADSGVPAVQESGD